MIQINLSESQARALLNCVGWGFNIPTEVGTELFIQLERQLTPSSTGAAELALWRHENGYTAKEIEDWKRKNETAEDSGL